MQAPVVIAPGDGEVVGDAPDRRVEILSDHDGLHATWSRFAAGRDGADLHVHRRHTDLFYVLDGELTLRLGTEGEEVALPQGSLALVPPLVVHGFRNGSDREVRYLNLHAPGQGFADFLRALRDGGTLAYDQEDPPAHGTRPPSDAVVGAPHARADGIRVARTTLAAETEAPGALPDEVLSLYVLDGDVAATLGDREVVAVPGTWIQIPAGVPHALGAAGGRAATVLALRTPA